MADSPSFDEAKPAWTLPFDEGWVTAVCFGAGRRLAAGNQLGQIFLWDLPDRPNAPAPLPVRRLDGHTNQITRLLASPDGRWLISASYDHTIRYWDLAGSASGTASVVMNPKAAAEKRGSKPAPPVTAQVEVQTAARVLDAHREWINGLVQSRDGKTLVSGDDGGQVIVWDAERGKERRRWKVKGWVYALALAPDAGLLFLAEGIPVYGQRHKAAGLYDPATGELRRDLQAEFKNEEFAAAAFSPDSKLLVLGRAGEGDGKVYFVDTASGKKLREMAGHQDGVTDACFSLDGRMALTSGRDTTIKVWQASDGKAVATLGSPRGGQFKDWFHALALTADERWIAAADMAGQVQVWAIV
jgi:WD40 repeat protein